MAAPGSHGSFARARGREHRHHFRLRRGTRSRTPPCGSRARRAREYPGPRARGLVWLVFGIHCPGARRQGDADVSAFPFNILGPESTSMSRTRVQHAIATIAFATFSLSCAVAVAQSTVYDVES